MSRYSGMTFIYRPKAAEGLARIERGRRIWTYGSAHFGRFAHTRPRTIAVARLSVCEELPIAILVHGVLIDAVTEVGAMPTTPKNGAMQNEQGGSHERGEDRDAALHRCVGRTPTIPTPRSPCLSDTRRQGGQPQTVQLFKMT
jgi:hypothetical protein